MSNNCVYKIGIDIGSTTLKLVVLNNDNEIVYKNYVRHKADLTNILINELDNLKNISSDFLSPAN